MAVEAGGLWRKLSPRICTDLQPSASTSAWTQSHRHTWCNSFAREDTAGTQPRFHGPEHVYQCHLTYSSVERLTLFM
eukprot:5707243-Amphidinium_carterae.2